MLVEAHQAQEQPPGVPNEILDYLTQPVKEMTSMEKFCEAFLAVATKNGGLNSLVSSRVVSKLREVHHIKETPPMLVSAGWLISYVSVGKAKIGQYMAGQKMLELSKKLDPIPDDPMARAMHLIGQNEALLAEKTELEMRLTAVERKLTQIVQTRDILKQLADALK